MKYFIIAFIWVAYCALHSYLISIGFTRFMMRSLKGYYAYYRLFYVIVSTVLLIPVISYTAQSDHQVIIHYSVAGNMIRYILIAVSSAILFWAFFFSYDFLAFLGFRQILNRDRKMNDQTGGIKQNGLLGIVRHPMYLAVIIILWCNTFKIADLVVNTVLTLYVIIGTLLEEKKLVLEFGDAYVKYQQKVPMLIPFIKMKAR